MASSVYAQAEFPMETTPVTLDGTAVGTLTSTTLSDNALLNSIVLVDGTYHMWARRGNGKISQMIHATSDDGIRFTTDAALRPPANYWTTCPGTVTPTTEPNADRLRVSKVGADWILMVWHGNQAGHDYYSYSSSVWKIGPDPNNLDIALIGPLPSQACDGSNKHPGRNHVGVFGMTDVDGEYPRIWLRDDHNSTSINLTGGALAGYEIDLSVSPPPTSDTPRYGNPATNTTYEFDLLAGTGYFEYPLPQTPQHSMVMPIGRTLDQGGTLGTYFAIVNRASQAPVDKELWYTESADGGATWSASVPIYGSGAGQNVLVDGLPNQYGFRAPEVVEGGVRTYFWTQNYCQQTVMVTAIDEQAKPKLTIVKDFEPNRVAVGGISQLKVTVTAPAICQPAPQGAAVTNLSYTDNLPGGGNVKLTGRVISNSCVGEGMAVSAPAEDTTFSLTGVDLPMGESCDLVVEVRGDVSGVYDNVIPVVNVTNALNWPAAAPARDTLTVGDGGVTPVPTMGTLSLAALGGLLGLFAVRRQRKHRKD